MRNLKHLLLLALFGVLFVACSGDDNGDTPEPINEEELITTMTVTLTPVTGDGIVVLSKVDTDGDGSTAPVVNVEGTLVTGLAYSGSIVLLDETETPAGNITAEVREESNEHQFIFATDDNLDVAIEYDDIDGNGNPVGLEFNLIAGEPSTGNLTIVLRHEPTKPNDGTLDGAGGETDVEGTFELTVE
ncbi:MAG: type 1 periplasmic binding fold superfamily protein [Pricia sp.]